jgi:hypothetical protein
MKLDLYKLDLTQFMAHHHMVADGDGLYLETEKNFSLKLVKKVEEEKSLENPLD